jgi:hypothetical protein
MAEAGIQRLLDDILPGEEGRTAEPEAARDE